MAPPTPRSKLSKAILRKAQEWRDVVAELPLLEQWDSLEEVISQADVRLAAAKGVEDQVHQRVSALQQSEASLSAKVAALEREVTSLSKIAQETLDKTKKVSEDLAREMADVANKTAGEIVGDARRQAVEIVSRGKTEVDRYQASLVSEVEELQLRKTDLQAEVGRLQSSHVSVTEALTSARQLLGVTP